MTNLGMWPRGRADRWAQRPAARVKPGAPSGEEGPGVGVDVGHRLVTQNQRVGAAGVASVGRVAAAPSHYQAASSIP